MPITSSAKKAVKVSLRRAQENQLRKVAYKSALKVARKAIVASDKKVADLIISAKIKLDLAVKTKLMHRNTASRLLSRLTHGQATTASVKPTKKAVAKAKVAKPKSKAKVKKA